MFPGDTVQLDLEVTNVSTVDLTGVVLVVEVYHASTEEQVASWVSASRDIAAGESIADAATIATDGVPEGGLLEYPACGE